MRRIAGEKDWGSYAIEDLGIGGLEVDPMKLSVDVSDCMYVSLSDIQVTFTQFNFNFAKKTFPKLDDVGTANATAKFDAFVRFDIVTDQEAITVDNVAAEVTIGELPVEVQSGKHKFMLNMLISLFSAKVKEAVSAEIKSQVDESIPLLKEKIAEVTSSFSPDLKGKIQGVDIKGSMRRMTVRLHCSPWISQFGALNQASRQFAIPFGMYRSSPGLSEPP